MQHTSMGACYDNFAHLVMSVKTAYCYQTIPHGMVASLSQFTQIKHNSKITMGPQQQGLHSQVL